MADHNAADPVSVRDAVEIYNAPGNGAENERSSLEILRGAPPALRSMRTFEEEFLAGDYGGMKG